MVDSRAAPDKTMETEGAPPRPRRWRREYTLLVLVALGGRRALGGLEVDRRLLAPRKGTLVLERRRDEYARPPGLPHALRVLRAAHVGERLRRLAGRLPVAVDLRCASA